MTSTMRAARFTAADRTLEVIDVPIPEPGPLEVLVKVDACGICLSDVHLIDGSIPPIVDVVTVGHEAAGTIAAVGGSVGGWRVGQRVSMMGGRPCGRCSSCARGALDECLSFELMGFHYDGAWAEYIKVPFFSMTPIPDNIVSEQAAILADAVATPYGALTDTAELKPGESVAVWGIGGLGTHAVQLARMIGAGLVIAIDPLASARERALKLGADAALDPREVDVPMEISRLTDGGVDVAIDLVGANAVLYEAVRSLRRRGRCVMVGLSMDRVELGPGLIFGTQSHSLRGHLGYRRKHLDDLVTLLANGRLDLSTSISEVMDLEAVPRGVERLASKEGDPVRLVVTP
ncbi:MAG TPA: zinc-binding dehydrogenase [Actinomycetota bacterium]|nr:zinc-binding dehydrogenase [Actinomycetota bacterium]